MAYKLNPFTGSFDLVEDNVTPQGNSIWVDAKKGNDNTGLLDRMDKPFATISAAVAVVKSAPLTSGNTFTIYIANGTYNIDRTTDSTLATLTKNRNYIFKCASRTGVVINNNGTGNNFMYVPITAGNAPRIEIHGGTWNHNTTGNMIWANRGQANYYFYNCNLNNNTGVSVFYKQSVSYAYGVTAISLVGNVFNGVPSGGNQVGGQRWVNCYFEAVSDYLDFGAYGSVFVDCTLTSLTAGYYFGLTPTGLSFKDCVISSFNRFIRTRPSFNLSFLGTCKLIMNSASAAIELVQTASNSTSAVTLESINIDTLIISYPLGSGSSGVCIQSGNGHHLPLIIRNHLISPRPPQAWQNGAVGFRLLAGGAVVGNEITLDLAGGYRGIAPITYTVASTVVADEIAAFKALIDAQVLIPGTPWNKWTGGDTSLVTINGTGLDFLRVRTAKGIASGYQIRGTYAWASATLGGITQSGIDALGTYNIGPGEFYQTRDEELWFGQGTSESERYSMFNEDRGIYS